MTGHSKPFNKSHNKTILCDEHTEITQKHY